MAAIQDAPKSPQRKSTLVVQSAYQIEGGEETEIVTHITVPTEGGWGWVVVFASFTIVFILDGVICTFGSLFADIRDDLQVAEYLVALINSAAFAMYYMLGPLASAIINRYGFRECTMVGSIICSFSLLCSYFSRTYSMVFMFYGICNGFGACLINLAASLVVGFYFDRLRALALAISLSGASVGCMIMYIANSKLVDASGWRVATLLHTGMFALIYFLGMTFKPLTPLLVTQTAQESATVVTNLPDISGDDKGKEGKVQRLLQAVSNVNFPTTADVVKQGTIATSSAKPGTSERRIGNYTLSTPNLGLNDRQLKKVQSLFIQPGQDKAATTQVTIDIKPQKKRNFWARLCHWQKQAPEARPMYRDDIFYNGKVNNLPAYKKSVIATDSKDRFAIEYHMAVTRAAAVDDINEKKYLCSTAVRRVLATMIDPALLKKGSFLMICISALFTYLGLFVPYIFLQDRNLHQGLDPIHCSSIISFIGFTNIIGRLVIVGLAGKLSPTILYVVAAVLAGIATMAFNFSFTVYYQYSCAGVLGFFNSCLVGLRSMIIVNLFGLENLTNATGLMLVFQGVGCLISTPLAMIIKGAFGYATSFYVAGGFLIISGIIMIPLNAVARKEQKKKEQEELQQKQNETAKKKDDNVAPVPPKPKEVPKVDPKVDPVAVPKVIPRNLAR